MDFGLTAGHPAAPIVDSSIHKESLLAGYSSGSGTVQQVASDDICQMSLFAVVFVEPGPVLA
jgi:hypothetical protein